MAVERVSKNTYKRMSGESISKEQIFRHIVGIIDGQFASANMPDAAIIEQLLENHITLSDLCYKGVSDIRVIVFNQVPIMAMLRIPTKESGGRANLHQGGALLGIDIARGDITTVMHKNRIIKYIPGTNIDPRGRKIPFWDDVLEMAIKSQNISKLGFLGCDIVIDQNDGPMVLELNGRPGMSIQIANRAPLRHRLEKVKDIRILNPKEGIQMGKQLFGRSSYQKRIEALSGKSIIGSLETLRFTSSHEENVRALARIDSNAKKSLMDTELAKELGFISEDKNSFSLKVSLGGEKLLLAFGCEPFRDQNEKIIIAGKDISGFLIDPNKALPKSLLEVPLQKEINYFKLDARLAQIGNDLNFTKALKPLNYEDEKNAFFVAASKGEIYNPHFIYQTLNIQPKNIRAELENLHLDQSALGKLFEKRRRALLERLAIIESRGNPDAFSKASKTHFGSPRKWEVNVAQKLLNKRPETYREDPKIYASQDIAQKFEEAISDLGMKGHAKVKIEENRSSAFAASPGSLTMRVSNSAHIGERRLQAVITHEIATHLIRSFNGSRNFPFKMFRLGVGNHLETEEGLAMYKERETILDEYDEKFYWPARNLLAVHKALHESFYDVYVFLLELGYDKEQSFRLAIRTKRGISDTSKPGAYTKDMLYFR